MDDDKKHPQGPTDIFDEHELDLNTPEDLEAIEDVTFAEPSEESMSIFDEFDDTDDFEDLVATPEEAPTMKKFEDEFTQEDLGYRPDNTATELLDEPFDFKEEKFAQNIETDEDMFASDAFEDVNTDFPEGESSNLGDSQLFDYDPSSSASEEEFQTEEIYEDVTQGAGGSSGKGGKGNKGGGGKGFHKNRRVIRLVILVALAGGVYAVLRVFTGSGEQTMEMAATPPVGTPPPMVAEPAPVETPEMTAPTETITETLDASGVAPETVEITSTEQVDVNAPLAVPVVPTTNVPTPVAGAAAPGAPVAQTTLSSVNQSPQTTLPVPTPGTVVTTHSAPATNNQINDKLDSLEASIHAIDHRLSNMSPGEHRSTVVTMKGSQASQAHDATLEEALEKINGIDKKISHLSELQTQIQVLNKEVNDLKSDVVQQSLIVGQNQAQVNQNMSTLIDHRAPKMYVQAAIPGRAWLRSETGQLLTVIPGDEVAGYGRVVTIDATTGTVVMSSRAVFREQ